MKSTIYKIATAAAGAALLLVGCDDEFTRPPMVTPPVLDIEPTATIADIKADYWQYVAGAPHEVGLTAAGDSVIIKGRVCSSDATGNIYKNIIIQSETPAGEQIALTFAVNNNKLYSTYKFGQEVFVNLTGLTVGGYSGLMQFGSVGTNGMSFMDSEVFASHVKASGMPKISAVDTTATTIAELKEAKATDLELWQSRLVRVDGIQFIEPGEVFAGSATTNRYVEDIHGDRLIVRTSAYASFKNERLPAGMGSVTGILSYYGSDWQILLIDEAGCQNFDGIPFEPIRPEAPETTSTIADVKAKYWHCVTGSPEEVGNTSAGSNVVVSGRVCSSDESGNIYKNIIIQSKTAEGEQIALTFAVNNSKLCDTYKFGQEVVLNLTGLSVGGYSGLMQFGGVGSNGMTFMNSETFSNHTFLVGKPDAAAVDTTATTIAQLKEVKNTSLELWQSRLVRVENVRFTEPGEPFAGAANTNRYIKDESGNQLLVRNSSYSSFKDAKLPAGKGSVTGILSYYGTDWQILLIDEAGCQGFDGSADTPVTPAPGDAVASISEKFDSDKIPSGWTSYKVKGDKAWYFTSFDNNFYAAMTGYKGTAPFDSWLVSPGLDMAKVTDKVLSFNSQVNGYGSTTTTMKVFVLTSPDPQNATKTELTAQWAQAPSSGYSGFVNSGVIDLSSYTGIIYIGFQYAATQDANYATWCIDDVYAGVKAPGASEEPGPDTPTGNSGVIYSSLTGAGDSMPEGWTIKNEALGTMEAIWKWEVYKDSGYLKGTSYGCSTATLAYAISPEIDLTGATGCEFSFDHAAKFQTTLKKLCGVVVREKGKTEWTVLKVEKWPEAGAWTFVNSGSISLADFDGKVIQIAFKYSGDKDGADTWEVNNLKVTGKK